MNDNTMAANNRATLLGTLAAKLTSAAYPIAARHGMKLFWVDLGIDLWTVLDERVKHRERELARAGGLVDFEAWRERLAAELTDAAYRITLQYGALGSFLDLELGLYHAFCQVVKDIGRQRLAGPILEVGLRGIIPASRR
ncbi:MAG TPA: hypothetical protein VG099_16470 [Gemmataceae bacterium]|jgi:hypothetical protein|nr:hypothetical protein [Gemmataceae bacterium]